MTSIEKFSIPAICDLAIANHIAHGGSMGGASLKFACENCGYDLFAIEEYEEKKGNRNQDIVIERKFYLRCLRCGSEEANHTLTIIPSWSGPCIDRGKIPVWEEEG